MRVPCTEIPCKTICIRLLSTSINFTGSVMSSGCKRSACHVKHYMTTYILAAELQGVRKIFELVWPESKPAGGHCSPTFYMGAAAVPTIGTEAQEVLLELNDKSGDVWSNMEPLPHVQSQSSQSAWWLSMFSTSKPKTHSVKATFEMYCLICECIFCVCTSLYIFLTFTQLFATWKNKNKNI